MNTITKLEDLVTTGQLIDFLVGTQAVAFSVLYEKDACYRWIQGELVKFSYMTLSKKDKGIVIQTMVLNTSTKRSLGSWKSCV